MLQNRYDVMFILNSEKYCDGVWVAASGVKELTYIQLTCEVWCKKNGVKKKLVKHSVHA